MHHKSNKVENDLEYEYVAENETFPNFYRVTFTVTPWIVTEVMKMKSMQLFESYWISVWAPHLEYCQIRLICMGLHGHDHWIDKHIGWYLYITKVGSNSNVLVTILHTSFYKYDTIIKLKEDWPSPRQSFHQQGTDLDFPFHT